MWTLRKLLEQCTEEELDYELNFSHYPDLSFKSPMISKVSAIDIGDKRAVTCVDCAYGDEK